MDCNLSEENLLPLFLQSYKNENTAIKKVEKKIEDINQMIETLSSSFETTIDDLSHKKNITKEIIKLFPCINCKSIYKNCEY
ncbi:hypothetical protein IKS57_05735 [bacterium]|nr:hypothetical protein [bacterium]